MAGAADQKVSENCGQISGGSMMVDMSVIILTKNEEKNLRKCVDSFQGIVKKFVVVDSFSTDMTEKLCRKLDSELRSVGGSLDFYQNPWKDYASQMNWALTQTNIRTAWAMRMDADEEMTTELIDEITDRLPFLPEKVSGVIVRRRVYFMGRWIRHGGRYPEYLLRIVRTGKALCEQKLMDEHLVLTEGKAVTFQHDLIDNNQKDLEWWTEKHNWYSSREALDHQMTMDGTLDDMKNKTTSAQAKRKRVLKNNGYYRLPRFLRAHLYFIYRYYLRLGFLDGVEGRIFHFLQAYWYRFLVDAKLYECNKKGIRMKPQGELKV